MQQKISPTIPTWKMVGEIFLIANVPRVVPIPIKPFDCSLSCANPAAEMSPFSRPFLLIRKGCREAPGGGQAPRYKLLSNVMRGYSFRPLTSQTSV